jgi:hypothetical protein
MAATAAFDGVALAALMECSDADHDMDPPTPRPPATAALMRSGLGSDQAGTALPAGTDTAMTSLAVAAAPVRNARKQPRGTALLCAICNQSSEAERTCPCTLGRTRQQVWAQDTQLSYSLTPT